MVQIRHISIATDDATGLAEFYKASFGLEEVSRNTPGSAATSVFLTDGYIHVALVPATTAGRREGMFHFGVASEDITGTLDAALAAGARPPKPKPADWIKGAGKEADTYVTDPAGIRIDIASGWVIGRSEAEVN
jgi:catechol 2,3-dioxygenase-like lactoylglutathione lyase family enzyme